MEEKLGYDAWIEGYQEGIEHPQTGKILPFQAEKLLQQQILQLTKATTKATQGDYKRLLGQAGIRMVA